MRLGIQRGGRDMVSFKGLSEVETIQMKGARNAMLKRIVTGNARRAA